MIGGKFYIVVIAMLLLAFPVNAQSGEEEFFSDVAIGVLPSSPLYILKQGFEVLQGFFAVSPEQKALFNLEKAKVRLAEANELQDRGETDLAVQQLELFGERIVEAREASSGITDEDDLISFNIDLDQSIVVGANLVDEVKVVVPNEQKIQLDVSLDSVYGNNSPSVFIEPEGPTDNLTLIALEDAFNNIELTDADFDVLDKEYGETFVVQANVIDGDQTIITHIIKDGRFVFITSEGTDLSVDEELTVDISVLEEIRDNGGLSRFEGIGLIFSGRLNIDPLFGLKLTELQNLPIFSGGN